MGFISHLWNIRSSFLVAIRKKRPRVLSMYELPGNVLFNILTFHNATDHAVYRGAGNHLGCHGVL